MDNAEHDQTTTELLRIVEATSHNLSPDVAGRVLALRDTDHAAYVKALELVARHKPRDRK